MSRLRELVGGPFGGAMLAALAIGAIELASLGAPALSADLGGVVLALHAALGLVVGALAWLTELAADRLAAPRLPGALLRALPTLPLFVWLGGTLFQGATAAALPGASLGHIWVPALGVLGVAAAIALGGRLLEPPTAARRLLVALPLLLLAAALEVADRRLYPSLYPDLHALLLPGVCIVAAAGLRAAVGPRGPGAGRPRAAGVLLWSASVAAVVLGAGLSLLGGLSDADSRWALATRGSHGRHLVRVVRDLFDRDGDGFSPVLGGGDCDDGAAAVNPGAAEVAQNEIDEDCDGADLARPPRAAPDDAAYAAALAAYRASPARAALLERAAGWNLLLLSVDSLRADVLADTAENRRDFPHLFALLDRSRRFDRAFSPSAGTDLSMSTALTGMVNPFQVLERTLLESVREGGRATHAVLPREVLRYAGKTLLTRGLEKHDVVINDREERDVSRTTSSAETTRLGLAALERLAGGDRPFLLWLHYFDVHEHLQVEASDPDLTAIARERGLDLGTRAGKYRALVGLVDREIGRLDAALEAAGLREKTAILFFSDHGESLAEDPRLPQNHGLYVYQPLVHVPLAIHLPGGRTGADPTPVSLIDLAPTVLDLVGAEPSAELGGRTLLPHVIDPPPGGEDGEALLAAPRPLVLNESDQWGLVLWPKKLLVRPADNLVELYDIERDPGERDDRAASEPDTVRRLKALYQGFPAVSLDRTRKARERREQLARPPRPR